MQPEVSELIRIGLYDPYEPEKLDSKSRYPQCPRLAKIWRYAFRERPIGCDTNSVNSLPNLLVSCVMVCYYAKGKFVLTSYGVTFYYPLIPLYPYNFWVVR
jgi:hypothetical protein